VFITGRISAFGFVLAGFFYVMGLLVSGLAALLVAGLAAASIASCV